MTGVEALVPALALMTGTAATACAWRMRAGLDAERAAMRGTAARSAALLEVARRLATAGRGTVESVRTAIIDAVRTLVPAIDTVLIFDEADGALRCAAAHGNRVAYFGGARIARGDPAALPARALACGHRVTLAEPGVRGFHPADAAAVAVPLARENGRASVLYVAAPQAIDAAGVEAIVALADHAGFAYALAHEREADRRRAEYDALTGLLTPRAFRERLGMLVERARYAPLARIALVFIDTDRFKAWNDAYGHASGDALLRAIARVLAAACTHEDLAARNGGDEFCLVFAACEKSAALLRAEAVRAAVAALDVNALRPAGVEVRVTVTASIGVAAYPADADSANDLLERADAAMYHSKRSGRDAVSFAAPDGTLVRLESLPAA